MISKRRLSYREVNVFKETFQIMKKRREKKI